ncbi:L-threonylcarbamoyladenylate synthase [Microlunatus sp. Gsoil 973]|uniref:L-threonylcarbamoyladenylate synthase n=1 Tax=Microlunatus sp. Gsoil 973 TaxID=2672569 RepID=UPI0012B4CED3|nr:L-threonylcarbamoyladenylate synthase [Microlunatus sp. Gsoil 973]QGN32312.1 threonylcarbamoyl-AMP synthase [Microlunatus sp. Gsoil 973]
MTDQTTDPGESQTTSEPPGPRYARYDCTDRADRSAVDEAAAAARRALDAGECIVLPTDTVYGIGADAYNADAVQRLLDAKGRGREKPPPVLISDAHFVKALAADVPDEAMSLVKALWPGALTIICKANDRLRMDLGETNGTVGLRVPDHPLTRELLRQTGPLAVSSANKTGRAAASTCDSAIEQLDDSVAVYLDGGELTGTEGKPSTIVDFTIKDTGQILRSGAISLETLQEYLPDVEDLATEAEAAEETPNYTTAELRARHTLQPPLETPAEPTAPAAETPAAPAAPAMPQVAEPLPQSQPTPVRTEGTNG